MLDFFNSKFKIQNSKLQIMLLCLLLFAFLSHDVLCAELDLRQVGPILDAAEGIFKAMKAKQYVALWEGLSAKSRAIIMNDIDAIIKKTPTVTPLPLAAIEKDMSQGGPIAQSYWNAVMGSFNPDMALEQCTWDMGPIKGNKAEVHLLFKKAERPAIIQMFRERGEWKVGLMESFPPAKKKWWKIGDR
jgi:hypothetical protein